VSSRLLRSPSGRVVAVEVTSPLLGLEVDYRFRVLGDEIGAVDGGVGFMGRPTGRPPLPTETSAGNGNARMVGSEREWLEAQREEARRLQAEGLLPQAQLAERVCGDRRFRSTVAWWLRQATVAENGDKPVAQ
jgi:hypothetical protein